MNDARSQRAAFGKLFEVKRERVGERARMNPGGGVDDHAGGLVDDDDLRVFVNDVERDVFGREFGGGRRGDFLDLDALARAELVRGLRGATADEYVAFFNRALSSVRLTPSTREARKASSRVPASASVASNASGSDSGPANDSSTEASPSTLARSPLMRGRCRRSARRRSPRRPRDSRGGGGARGR